MVLKRFSSFVLHGALLQSLSGRVGILSARSLRSNLEGGNVKVGYGLYFDYGNPKEEMPEDRLGRQIYEAFWKLWKVRVTFDTFLGMIPDTLAYLERLGIYKTVFYTLLGSEPKAGVLCEEDRTKRLEKAALSGTNLMIGVRFEDDTAGNLYPGTYYHVPSKYKDAEVLIKETATDIAGVLEEFPNCGYDPDNLFASKTSSGVSDRVGKKMYREMKPFPFPSIMVVLPKKAMESNPTEAVVTALAQGLETMRNAI